MASLTSASNAGTLTHSEMTASSGNDGLYAAMLEASPLILIHYDKLLDVLTVSPPAENGVRPHKTLRDFCRTLPANPYIPFNLRQNLLNTINRYCAAPYDGSLSMCLDLYRSGVFRWYMGFFHSHHEADGRVRHITGYFRDIQTEKISEQAYLSIYQKAVDFASLFVYEFDLPDYHPQDVGHHHSNDYEPLSSYLSSRSYELIHPDDLTIFKSLTQPDSLLGSYRAQQYELRAALRLRSKAGDWHWVQFTLHLSHASGSHEAHGIGYIQLIQSQKLLEERAARDAVTGLLNRATLEERIQTALRQTTEPCYFFIYDIDNFKAVNDQCGHLEGDRALKLIANAMRRHTRRNDLLGRVGGDEFIALMRGLPSAEAALRRVEELLAAVRAIKCPAHWRGVKGLSLSVGMAVSDPCHSSYESLYQAADKALYEAKGQGKDRCCIARVMPASPTDDQPRL